MDPLPDRLRGASLEELRRELVTIDAQIRNKLGAVDRDTRGLGAAELEEYDGLLALRDNVASHIDQYARASGALQRGRGLVFGGPAGATRTHRDGIDDESDLFDYQPVEVGRMSTADVRSRALSILEARSRNLKPDQADRIEKLIRDADDPEARIAIRTALTESPTYKAA